MEDDINLLMKWKTTSIIKANERQNQFFRQMEEDLNYLGKWKTTSIVKEIKTTSVI